MSRFLSDRLQSLEAYVPGEQPRIDDLIKLNTNESPFPPAPGVTEAVKGAAAKLQLYNDLKSEKLVRLLADTYGVQENQVAVSNGSDEMLAFAFQAFGGGGLAFPDITYGFYPVFAQINQIPYTEIPLREDFTLDPEDYKGIGKTIFIANPNAPTGIALSPGDIEKIAAGNPDNVVVIDEAYVDFGAQSCVPLIHKYPNLLVTQTFSKSRSMAGARLGMGIGSAELIRDLNAVKYSVNPYNVNSMTMAAGIGALRDEEYFASNCRTIIENRTYTVEKLKELGFKVTDSSANFIFVTHPGISGYDLYVKLKSRGVLIRYLSKERIKEYSRITIGTKDQMDILLDNIRDILNEK